MLENVRLAARGRRDGPDMLESSIAAGPEGTGMRGVRASWRIVRETDPNIVMRMMLGLGWWMF